MVMNAQGGKSQIKSGAILSYSNIALTLIIALFFLPYLITSLGKAEYGLYTLIGSFIGYFTLFDFGLSGTIVRYITKYRLSGEKQDEQIFLGMVLVFYAAIALVVLLIGYILVLNIERIFKASLSLEEIKKARIMLGIVVVSFAVSLPGRVYHGIISAYERFNILKIIPMFRSLMRIALFISVLQLGYGAVILTLIEAVLSLAVMAASMIYAHTRLTVKIRIGKFDKDLFRRLFSFSLFIFIGAVVEQINFRLDNLLLGVMAGTQAVAVYGLAANLILIFREIAGVI
jgi:O-antigen/teichoic acid export membrane protein